MIPFFGLSQKMNPRLAFVSLLGLFVLQMAAFSSESHHALHASKAPKDEVKTEADYDVMNGIVYKPRVPACAKCKLKKSVYGWHLRECRLRT